MTLILSAKHGLIHLEKVIDPYELTLNTFSKLEKKTWANKVIHKMKALELGHDISVFAGYNYICFLPRHIKIPLQGLSLGFQLQWFNQRLSKRGFNL